jgi:AcrR family transcriptional regulator
MGIREDQRQRTRQAILVAAATEIEHRGFQATSYATIAQRAGVAKSLVSYHFASKNDFVRGMFDAAFRQDMYPAPLPEELAPLDDLAQSTVNAADQEQTDPIARAALRLQRESHMTPEVELPQPFVRWIARCEMLIGKAAERGEIRGPVDTVFEAHLLVAQYVGIRDLAAAAGRYEHLMEQTAIGSLDRFIAMGATPAAMVSATERTVRAMRRTGGVGIERIEERLRWPGAGARVLD